MKGPASRRFGALAAVGLLAACSGSGDRDRQLEPEPTATSTTPTISAPSHASWDLVSSGEGAGLVFPATGAAAVRLFCPAGGRRILVNVPAFRPIGSEERLSFGSGGNVEALVADTRGDRQRGGVSGTGAVPRNLSALVAGPLSVSYGAQSSGPHPGVPQDLARDFVTACNDAPPPTSSQAGQVGACLMQGEQRLSVAPLRAIGTEPFWGAVTEGRCVTYSHPEDQNGTRVWTRYAANGNGGGTWTGTLEGRPFVLATRRQPGCSDGMSDNRYPLAVELTVGGEERRGCARPA